MNYRIMPAVRHLGKNPLKWESAPRETIQGEWLLEFLHYEEWLASYYRGEGRTLEIAVDDIASAAEDYPETEWRIRNLVTGETISGAIVKK